jgi:hypothetical protein
MGRRGVAVSRKATGSEMCVVSGSFRGERALCCPRGSFEGKRTSPWQGDVRRLTVVMCKHGKSACDSRFQVGWRVSLAG